MPKGRPLGSKDSKPRVRRWYKAESVETKVETVEAVSDAKSRQNEEPKATEEEGGNRSGNEG